MFKAGVLVLLSSQAFAAVIPTIPLPTHSYRIEVQLKRQDHIEKKQIVVQEGEDGAILSNAGPKQNSSFSAIVHQTGENEINLSYRVKQTLENSKLDFARADIPLQPNLPLVVTAQDDNEQDVEIRVTVTKQ